MKTEEVEYKASDGENPTPNAKVKPKQQNIWQKCYGVSILFIYLLLQYIRGDSTYQDDDERTLSAQMDQSAGHETPGRENHPLQQRRDNTRPQDKRPQLRSRRRKANIDKQRYFHGKERPKGLLRCDSQNRKRKELVQLPFKHQGRKAVILKPIDVDIITGQRDRLRKAEPAPIENELEELDNISVAHLAHRGRPPDIYKTDGT